MRPGLAVGACGRDRCRVGLPFRASSCLRVPPSLQFCVHQLAVAASADPQSDIEAVVLVVGLLLVTALLHAVAYYGMRGYRVSGWVALVRAVGKARIEQRLPRYKDTGALTRALVAAAILYRFWDPLLVEAADLKRLRETYLDTVTGHFNEAAYRALAEAIRTLATERKLQAPVVEEIARHCARAMDELASGKGFESTKDTKGHEGEEEETGRDESRAPR